MQFCDTVITGAMAVTQDDQRRILPEVAIAITQGRISALDAREVILPRWQPRQLVDLPDAILLPGLINAHAHGAMTFLRACADDLPLLDWLHTTVFPVERRLTPDIVRLGALLGHAEMLATGTTACVDMYIFEEAVFEAAAMAGIRCLGGEAIFQFPSAACGDYREAILRTEMLAEKYQGDDRIAVAVNPHSVYTTTSKMLEECRHLAQSRNLPLHIHLAETPQETRQCLTMHGRRPVAQVAACGLLDTRLIAAHVVDIDEAEAQLLAQAGATAVHNPASNMKLASGVAPVPMQLAAGLHVALGTDGAASNNQLNLFADMRLAALLHKVHTADPAALPAQQVLDMATRGGALALGRPDLGQLAVGFPADIVALDATRPNMLPLHNPISQLVYAASGHECRLTMVAGEVLYRDGQFTRFDYQALREEAASMRKFVEKRS